MSSENLVYKITTGALNQKALDKDLIPASKSYCNRALILAALKGRMGVKPLAKSSDTEHLIKALKDVGINLKIKDNGIYFLDSFFEAETKNKKQKLISINAFDGGTTSRFLMALLACGKNPYFLILNNEMLKRPMDDLINALKFLGAEIKPYQQNDQAGFFIQGPLTKLNNNENVCVEIESKKTSQFYTALQLITLKYPNLSVIAKNLKNSKKYAQMTDEILKLAKLNDDLNVANDFSSLGYLVAFLSLSGGGVIPRVYELDHEQADSALFSILKEANADIIINESGIRVSGSRDSLKPFIADASLYPDLIPTLVFLAAHIEGKSEFKNLEILTYKESNREKELVFLLELFGVEHIFDSTNHYLQIYGSKSKTYRAIDYYPPNDHRMIMTAALFMRLNYGGLLYKAQHVKKSFPDFFEFLAD